MNTTHNDIMVAFGEAVRSIAGDSIRSEQIRAELEQGEDLRAVGGYLIRFGEDQRDTYGTYWSEETYLGARKGDEADCLVHHGIPLNKEEDFVRLADVLLNPIRTTVDEFGLWAETVLNMNDEYQKKIVEMVERGALSWSSGTAEHMMRVDKDGYVRRWPVIEGSLTPTPANYREGTKIAPLRSISEPTQQTTPAPEALRAEFFGESIEIELTSTALSRLHDKLWWKISEVLWDYYVAPRTLEEKLADIQPLLEEYNVLVVKVMLALMQQPESEQQAEETLSAIRSAMTIRAGKMLSKKTESYLDEILSGGQVVVDQVTALRAAAADGKLTDEEVQEIAESGRSADIKEAIRAELTDMLTGVDLKKLVADIAEIRAMKDAPKPKQNTTKDPVRTESAPPKELTLEDLRKRQAQG